MFKFLLATIPVLLLSACNERPHVLTRSERMTAEIGARDYGEKNNLIFVSCFGKDINGNGVISCTLRGKESASVETLLCTYEDGGKGCRPGQPEKR